MSRFVDIDNENFWDILFDEACVEGKQAERIEKELNKISTEYNNNWIPCEKELPKIPNSYLVTKMCKNDGNPIYETSHEIFWTSDRKWDCERDEDCDWKVIAWQNKFKPYIPETN